MGSLYTGIRVISITAKPRSSMTLAIELKVGVSLSIFLTICAAKIYKFESTDKNIPTFCQNFLSIVLCCYELNSVILRWKKLLCHVRRDDTCNKRLQNKLHICSPHAEIALWSCSLLGRRYMLLPLT